METFWIRLFKVYCLARPNISFDGHSYPSGKDIVFPDSKVWHFQYFTSFYLFEKTQKWNRIADTFLKIFQFPFFVGRNLLCILTIKLHWFLFCLCRYYLWFKKRANKGPLPLQNFTLKLAQQSFKYIFFNVSQNHCNTCLLSWCFNETEFFVIQPAPTKFLNVSCQHWSPFNDSSWQKYSSFYKSSCIKLFLF